MAIVNSKICLDGRDFSLNFNGNTVSIGQVWSAGLNDPNKPIYCVEITSLLNETSSEWNALTQYSNCYDCLSENYGVIALRPCFSREGDVILPISGISETFFNSISIGSIVNLEFEYLGALLQGCFELTKILTLSQEEFSRLLFSTFINGSIETDCETCIQNNSFIAEVGNCDGENIHYVLLPTTGLDSHTISYTDGIDEYCGVVRRYITEIVPYWNFVSDYGFKTDCEVCLENVNVKYKLVNCIDSNTTEVVWGSQLFINGQVSNLSTSNGCFEVSGVTTDPVTTNLFLDFEPNSDCESCLECSGVYYQYSICGDIGNITVGEILSYQVLPLNSVFWHPVNGWCVIQSASNGNSGTYDTFYSVVTATDCDTLPNRPETWVSSECTNGFQIYVMTDETVTVSNITQAIWSNTNLFCVELTQNINDLPSPPSTGSTYFNTANNIGGSTLIYSNCDECVSNTNVGVSTINCNTSDLQSFDIPYLTWCQMTNYGGFGNNGFKNICFSDNNGDCRKILDCPKPLSGNLIIPFDTYYNCPSCTFFNPILDTVSAGTEYFICNICDNPTGTTITEIRPPHPVWTRPNGQQVVLLDAVQLGGMYGLNS